jgi:hypothetical protein
MLLYTVFVHGRNLNLEYHKNISRNHKFQYEVTGEWRKLHNEELHDLYSNYIVRVIKSRTMRWAGRVARMGKVRGVYTLLVGKLEGHSPLGRSGVDGRIILRWIFRKWAVRESTGLIWLRIGTGGGHL